MTDKRTTDDGGDRKLAAKLQRCLSTEDLLYLVEDRLPAGRERREDAHEALAALATMVGLDSPEGVGDWLAAHPPLPDEEEDDEDAEGFSLDDDEIAPLNEALEGHPFPGEGV